MINKESQGERQKAARKKVEDTKKETEGERKQRICKERQRRKKES